MLYKFLNNLSIKEIILTITQTLAIITSLYAIIIIEGWDTVHIRSIISLIPFTIATLGAFIAYKQYLSNASDRRKQFYLKYYIDPIEEIERTYKIYTANQPITLTSKNFFSATKSYFEYEYLFRMESNQRSNRFFDLLLKELLLIFHEYTREYVTQYKSSLELITKIQKDEQLTLKENKIELIEIIINKSLLELKNFYLTKGNEIKENPQNIYEQFKNALYDIHLFDDEHEYFIKSCFGEFHYLISNKK